MGRIKKWLESSRRLCYLDPALKTAKLLGCLDSRVQDEFGSLFGAMLMWLKPNETSSSGLPTKSAKHHEIPKASHPQGLVQVSKTKNRGPRFVDFKSRSPETGPPLPREILRFEVERWQRWWMDSWSKSASRSVKIWLGAQVPKGNVLGRESFRFFKKKAEAVFGGLVWGPTLDLEDSRLWMKWVDFTNIGKLARVSNDRWSGF